MPLDGDSVDFKQALSRELSVDVSQIVLGTDFSEVFEATVRAFLRAGERAVLSQYSPANYLRMVQQIGACAVEVPARAFGHDLAAMADAVCDDTHIVFLGNPNGLTGTFLPGHLLEAFLERLPTSVVAVLDEAYGNYLPRELCYQSTAWPGRFPKLIVLRSSCFFGHRIGYGVSSPDLVGMVMRQQDALRADGEGIANAEMAEGEYDHAVNCAGMAQIVAELDALNLEHIPSVSNFVSFRCGDGEGICRRLLLQGVKVLSLADYGMSGWLRVTIGREAANARFLSALAMALKG